MNYRISILLIIFGLILGCSCKKGTSKTTIPGLLVNSAVITVAEDDPSASVNVQVALSGAYNSPVSVNYKTSDSTGIAGKDYVAETSGKLTFLPGETSKIIKINILSDTAQKNDVYFKVELSNPVNSIIVKSDITVKIINVDYSNLVWSDEFTAGPLNPAYWNFELGAGGWGNNELENYTNSVANVHIDSGYLHITALDSKGSSSYTSGRITTQGKKEFTYCRVEIRAKLPEGNGIWPALWMLGANISSVNWPKCGEIDIMELIGNLPSTVYGTVHWNDNGHVSKSNSYSISGTKFSSGFHVFSLVWTPNRITWLVDNQQFANLNRSEIITFPFDLPQFFIFNVAVGGNWPGSPDGSTLFPQNMIVDYIRVYQ